MISRRIIFIGKKKKKIEIIYCILKKFFKLFGTLEFANSIRNNGCLDLPGTKSNNFDPDKFAVLFLELAKEVCSHSLM